MIIQQVEDGVTTVRTVTPKRGDDRRLQPTVVRRILKAGLSNPLLPLGKGHSRPRAGVGNPASTFA